MKPKRPTQRDPSKVAFSVALPKILVWQIEQIAEAEHRSRNGQIEHFLADSVARWKRENPQAEAHVAEDQAPYGVTAPTPAERVLQERADTVAQPVSAPVPPAPGAAKGRR